MMNTCMTKHSFSLLPFPVRLEGLYVHKYICESGQRASEKQNLVCTIDQINKHIREHLKYAHLRLGGKGETDHTDDVYYGILSNPILISEI